MRVLLIDNYDSFTFNLVHLIGGAGAEVEVMRNDAKSADDVIASNPEAIVISPGPCTPNEAGISLALIDKAAKAGVPLFGVCLGHQAIGQAFGGNVIRNAPMHGKISQIKHQGQGLFRGINADFAATRYHSLVVERKSLPETLEITAASDDGLIMALQHKTLPIHGVQFHPESISTEHGHVMIHNFLSAAALWNQANMRNI